MPFELYHDQDEEDLISQWQMVKDRVTFWISDMLAFMNGCYLKETTCRRKSSRRRLRKKKED